MKEYEEEIISTIKSLVINGIKNLDGYNNPFKNVANALIMEHDLSCSEYAVLLEDSTLLKVHKIGD